jgi:non-specific serine/threonine protein kinase/serine/threonine-protein kinase
MSDRAGWEDAKRLFHAALTVEPAGRDAYLREACGGSTELLAEVQSLLDFADDSTGFLETPVARVGDLPLSFPDGDALTGQSLGPWRIVGVIGRGGMGVVYRAERADAAFKRQAAIKVVRRGARAADIVDRFRRERETLAALDHPHIARVMDGGSTPDGSPYFVMEYVDGVRVDSYCDEHRLTIDERLVLFRTICDAVQHAHQSLVIHRDLKPDNILVSKDGVAKLLDFGIARLLSEDTRAGDDVATAVTWLMTPDYASPEQVSGRAVTTASDVYSLGVLLHVLLTGVPPYRLTGATQAEIGAALARALPIRPSARLAGDAAGDERAALRGTTRGRLVARVAGDLDAIVLRALSRDPRTRYATVQQLAEDLERHRTLRPVMARGEHLGYRAGRFAQRHVVALGVAAGALVLIAAGVAGVLWQASIAEAERGRAERRFEDVRQLARAFMFDVHDEIVNVPGTTRARELMVRTASDYLSGLAREAGGDMGLQRELAAAFVRVGDAQGNPYSANVGDIAGARASYERAIEIAGGIVRGRPDEVESGRTLAMAHRRLSDVLAWAGDTAAALTHCDLSQGLFARIGSLSSATTEDRLQVAVARIKQGDLLGNPSFPNLNRRDEANLRYAEAQELIEALDAAVPGDPRVRRYLGLIFERTGAMSEAASDWSQAEAAYRRSFAIRETLVATAPAHTDIQRDYAIAYEKLGNVQLATGEVAGAALSYRGALAQFERLAQADRSNASAARTVAISREKLALTLVRLGERVEGTSLLTLALQGQQELATRDASNAQARCDVARLVELLGDTAADGGEAGPRVCGSWRESLRARERLVAGGMGCASGDDIQRLTAKLQRCN